MNDYFQAFWLALLQGLTEFLPVSSSGHLILVPHYLGWNDRGLAFDIAVHLGTLVAVLAYFRADLYLLWRGALARLRGDRHDPHGKLATALFISAAIIAVAGALFADWIAQHLRAPTPIAWATLLFGVALGLADWRGKKNRALETLRRRDVLWIALAQTLALIPGTSRAGVTITAGLALGLTREAAARFSFLLAIPVIALAGGWQTRRWLIADAPIDWGVLAFACALSAATAFVCIHWFLRFIQKRGLWWFVVYRIALAVLLLHLFA